MGWLRRYERFWREKLDALEAFLRGQRKAAGQGSPPGKAVDDNHKS